MFVKPTGNKPSPSYSDVTKTIQTSRVGEGAVFGFKGDPDGLYIGPNDAISILKTPLGEQNDVIWFSLTGQRVCNVMIEAKPIGQATTPVYFQLAVVAQGAPHGPSSGPDAGNKSYIHPGQLSAQIAVFWVTNYFGGLAGRQMQQADALLREHGMHLNIWPSEVKTGLTTLEFPDRVIEEDDYNEMRRRVMDILATNGKSRALPVLFAQYRFPSNGLTKFASKGVFWPTPIVLVSPTGAADNVTLLHEMGHAASLDHDRTSTGATGRNFMNETESRSTLMRWQIETMANAFFVRK